MTNYYWISGDSLIEGKMIYKYAYGMRRDFESWLRLKPTKEIPAACLRRLISDNDWVQLNSYGLVLYQKRRIDK